MAKSKRASGKWVLRGSLIELRRRCGKAGCHCGDGEPHCSPALSYSQNGTTHIITLTDEDVNDVKTALKRYRLAARQLEERAMAGVMKLRQRIQRRAYSKVKKA